MIQFKQLKLARSTKVLIENASFQLHPGHKVGLTGANGTGKSSLFSMLMGELSPESGTLEISERWVIAHVAQETPALAESALDFTMAGDAELVNVQAALTQAEQSGDGEKIAALHQRLGEIDGYSAKARAASLLNGLGFTTDDYDKAVREFSGGWRVRLNLARALMCRSDLLLLDEPTNHLDLDAVFWLAAWLRDYRGTLLLISHDRDFLDEVVNHILHIEQQSLTLYKGGYSDFERQRAEKLALQQAMFEKQQRKMAHLHKYIDRFRAQATKAKQAQSRIKALERMEKISAAHVDSQFNFVFREPLAAPDPLLVLDQVNAGYQDQVILKEIAMTIRPGERVGLLGKNGAGKSTLIKLLATELQPLSGKRTEGKALKIAYFAQHQIEQLRLDESPLQHLQRLDAQTPEQAHLNFLGGFDFQGDMAKAPCEHFSGGEKSRLALAMLVWAQPNLLLLDEPTNHLDLEMRHALTLALQTYQGGVVLVSHDSALLRASCDQFILVADGSVKPFDGDLEDYKTWLAQEKQQENQVVKTEEKPVNTNTYLQKKADRQARIQERRPLLKKLEKIDKNLAKLLPEKEALDTQLADSNIYEAENKATLQELLIKQAEVSSTIETLEMEWLEVQEALEAIPTID